jgi:hypothetical protein
MADAQADIVLQLFPLLDALRSRQTDAHAQDSLLGAMRAARWWCVEAAQLDREEAALADRGGFLVAVDKDEAFEAALLSYYNFGNMVIDRLAAFAMKMGVDRAWMTWLQTMDAGSPTRTRALARELDVLLRVPRDKLATHLGVDAKLTWALSGSGSARVGALRDTDQPLPPQLMSELNTIARAMGAEIAADHFAVLSFLEVMGARAEQLDQHGREAYRAAAEVVGLESAPVFEVTWRVVGLVRSLG